MPDVSYVPGSMTAVIGDGSLALLSAPPDSPAVAWVWQRLSDRARANTILVGLLGVGVGFGGAADFALLAPGDDGLPRVFCRGAGSATVLGGAAPARLDGIGLSTWSERLVGAEATQIVIGELPAHGALRLPASSGILLAGCVIIDIAGLADDGLAGGDGPARLTTAGGEASGDTEAPIALTWRTLPLGTKATGAIGAAGAIGVARAVAPVPAEPVPADLGSAESEPVLEDTVLIEDTVADPAPAAGDNFHDTVTVPGEGSGDPRTGATRAGVPTVPPGLLIDAVPWAVPDAGRTDEADGATVRRAALAAFAAPRSTPPPDRIGPMVAALVCPAGHANPPSNGQCRWCGASLQDDPVMVPRPVLGVLVTSLGDVIALDRGVIMGRNPSADADGRGEQERPHVVKLPGAGGDISRNHLRVTLDGWHVLIADLNSTNGTLVELPGRDALQLRPGDSMPIQPGTVVTLAEGIDFRYEVRE